MRDNVRTPMKIRPNDACPCGSGRKYKKCHGAPASAPPPLAAATLVAAARHELAAGALPAAEARLQQALRIDPVAVDAWRALAEAAERAGDLEAAEACRMRVVELLPLDAVAHFALGNVLARRYVFERARTAYLRATELAPGLAGAWGNLGNVHKYLGDFHAAIDCLRREFALEPDLAARARRHSNLLLSLHYDESLSAQVLLDAHVEWAECYARPWYPAQPVRPERPDPGRRLRLGYLSGSMNGQIVGHFLANVLAHHDPAQFEVHGYSATRYTDAMTEHLRRQCHAWTDLTPLDDAAAADAIRADGIDILVDLDGHAPAGRPLVVARKPAPLVVEWLDYFDTTGMRVVDYLLTDPYTTPEGSPQRFVETPYRLPHTRFCYAPPAAAPAVAPAPAALRGHVTFGSFNRQDKLHPALVGCWSRILRAVPGARLLLKNRALQVPAVREALVAAFAREGIPAERIELRGPSPHAELLAEYADVDIALDTFPYNGGLTTCECLWMGVPIVALEAERMIGRQTAALLRLLALDDWVASDIDAYVALATAKAAAVAATGGLRSDIRSRMAASPLTDAPRFVDDLEAAYRALWVRCCATSGLEAQPTSQAGSHSNAAT